MMMSGSKLLVQTSKFLSWILRHQPESIGLTLDEQGWAKVEDLLHCATQQGIFLSRSLLEEVVQTSDKQRFAFSPDGQRIRANQGHSIAIDLNLPPVEPPEMLYHGTAVQFLDSIRTHGLQSGQRQYVHLSSLESTALQVGQRHGKAIVLRIRAQDMCVQGYRFFCAENGVWLTAVVPPQFIDGATLSEENSS
jgi:putative RNA 2'-phosphotransferase